MRTIKKAAVLTAIILILAYSMYLFSPSFTGASEAVEGAADVLEEIIPEKGAELTSVKVKVLFSDIGVGRGFTGNETGSPKPVRNAAVWMGGDVALTNLKGEAVLRVPKGNLTLYVSKDGRTYWKGDVKIDGGETIVVKFFLYRVNPETIEVRLDPFEVSSPVTLTFNTPLEGRYYVGKPVVTFYTPWGELRTHVFEEGKERERIVVIGEAESVIRMVKSEEALGIDYKVLFEGGVRLTRLVRVDGNPAYVVPELTYLPVERVELVELP